MNVHQSHLEQCIKLGSLYGPTWHYYKEIDWKMYLEGFKDSLKYSSCRIALFQIYWMFLIYDTNYTLYLIISIPELNHTFLILIDLVGWTIHFYHWTVSYVDSFNI